MHAKVKPCPRLLEYRPPRIAMLLLLIATLLHWASPGLLPRLATSALLAIVIAATGFVLMLRAWWLFRQVDTAICPTAASSTLITRDVYSWTRNPMYLGMVLMLLGVALYTGSLFHYAAMCAFFVLIDHSFCPYEENKMRAEFGDVFDSYTSTVRRWL